MSLINCIDSVLKDVTDKVMSPSEKAAFKKEISGDKDLQGDEARKAVIDYHEKLHNELNKLKSKNGIATTKYKRPDNSKEIKNIHAEYDKKIAETKGSGVTQSNWREEYKKADAFKKSAILRAVVEVSKSDKELSDVLDILVKGAPQESNVAWDVANNPNSSKETFERAVSNKALRKSTTDENIQFLREKRFGKEQSKSETLGQNKKPDVVDENKVDEPIPEKTDENITPPPSKTNTVSESEGSKTNKISKKGLKADYNFSKKFASKGDQQIADETTDRLQERADENSIPIEQQAANEVAAMKNKTGEATEHDIMTAAYHLRNLDAQIEKANELGTDVTDLVKQRDDALTTLRQLGNNAGRNLRLFGSVYKMAEEGRLEVTRAALKKDLGVSEVPKTMAELKESNLSATDKKKIEPYVQAIEELNKTLADIKKETDKTISDIHSKDVQDYIKAEIEKGIKSGKSNKNEALKSQKEKAAKRTAEAFKNFRKASGLSSGAPLEALPEFIEVIKALVNEGYVHLKSIISKFRKEFPNAKVSDEAIEKRFNEAKNESKEDAITKIQKMAKAENATTITKDMVKHGLINDVVNHYIHSDTPYDKVIPEATAELQKHLPDVDERTVENAILKKGEFKPESKVKAQTEFTKKQIAVKRIASTSSKVKALEKADEITAIVQDTQLTNKQKKAQVEATKSDYEKSLDKKLADHEQSKKDAIANSKKAKDEYKRLETERNRQLAVLEKLKTEKERLLSGQKKESAEKRVPEKDTPEIEAAKKEIKDIEQQIREGNEAIKKVDRDRNSQIKSDNKKLETERNRQLQRVADLTEKRDKLLAGIRETKAKAEPKVDTPEIEALKKQISDADKALRETENAQRKAQRDADNEQQKLDDVQAKIDYVKLEKRMFDSAIKSPKAASAQLKAAKEELAKAYNEAGIRPESGSKTEIKIAQDADAAIKEIKDSDLDEATKKEHIKKIEAQRDEQLNKTKQGVLTNLRDNIDAHIEELTTQQNDAINNKDNEKADAIGNLKEGLQNLSKDLKPNLENLKDQIDKADQNLNAIIKEHEGTEFENNLKDISKNFHDNWQKTADELSNQQLMDKAVRSEKEAQRRMNAMQYTEVPTTVSDIKTNNALAEQTAKTQKAWAKLNSMALRAKEQNQTKSGISKWLAARRQWLVASIPAIEKVLGSGLTKPIFDPFIKQTFGRLSAYVTGVEPTAFSRLVHTYRQMKDEAAANRFMRNANNAHVDAIINYDKAVKDFGKDDPKTKEAYNKLLDAEIDNNAAMAYLFVNAGSHIDIKQIMLKGATDFDAKLGKYKQSLAQDRKTAMQSIGFWLESVNRTHSAIKSVSHRQALMDSYIENLQIAQKKDGEITNESRQRAWDAAVLESESGRFGENTQLSKRVSRQKNAENAAQRNVANYLLPVAKISINITKQGIDMAFPFEAMAKTSSTILKGVKLNEADGLEFKGARDKFYNGMRRGFEELPLEQKKYINTLISRGLFGVAQYAVVYSLLASGFIKYGGAYDESDPFHNKYKAVKGEDGEPLKLGEWEIGGHKMGKIFDMIFNHSPYSLPASVAAVSYQQLTSEDKKGKQIYHAFTKTINEVYERLPFATGVDLLKAFSGDEYQLERIVANEIPTAKTTAEFFDKDAEGNPVDRKTTAPGFWQTVGNMAAKNIPFVRNTLDVKNSNPLSNTPEGKLADSKHYTIKPPNTKTIKVPDKYYDKDGNIKQEFIQPYLDEHNKILKSKMELLNKYGAVKTFKDGKTSYTALEKEPLNSQVPNVVKAVDLTDKQFAEVMKKITGSVTDEAEKNKFPK